MWGTMQICKYLHSLHLLTFISCLDIRLLLLTDNMRNVNVMQCNAGHRISADCSWTSDGDIITVSSSSSGHGRIHQVRLGQILDPILKFDSASSYNIAK